MIEANRKSALAFLDAMSAGDADGAARLLTDDAFTVSRGFGKVSGRRDRATMLATMSAFKELVPTGFRPTFHSIVAEGDKVVVEFDGNAELRNGTPYRNQYCMVFTFEGDRIKQLNEYFCTVLADAVMLPLLMEQGSKVAWK
jgi:ketosteroid isomerase-like protein